MSCAFIWAAPKGGATFAVAVEVDRMSWSVGYARRSHDANRVASVAVGSNVRAGVPIVYRMRTSRTRSGAAGRKVTFRTDRPAIEGSDVPVVRCTGPIRRNSVPAVVTAGGSLKFRLK